MKNKNTGNKKILIILLALLVLGSAVFAYQKHHKAAPLPGALIKQAEKQDVNNNKASLPANSEGTGAGGAKNGSSSSTPSSNVIITSALASGDTITISSYVSGIIEDGGTCKLTLQKGSSTVTRADVGISDASHTTCPTFSIDNTSHVALAAGIWSATVTYSSTKHPVTISSQAQAIEVK